MHPFALVFIVFSFTLLFSYLRASLLLKKGGKEKKKALNVPPGNTYWPLIGETIHFARLHRSTSLGEFLEQRRKRYGKIYTSHLLGKPAIISTDVDFNKFVLRNDGKLFDHAWPPHYEKIFNSAVLGVQTGENFRVFQALTHDFLGIPNLKNRLLPNFEVYTLQLLDSWKEGVTFPLIEESSKVTFNLMLKNILSLNPGDPKLLELRELYSFFTKGLTAFPIDLPGTNYRKGIQSMAAIIKVLEGLIKERVQKRETGQEEIYNTDYLDLLLNRSDITAGERVHHAFGMIFAGYGTSSLAIAMAMYFLASSKEIVEQLREEHLAIDKKKKERGDPWQLTWEDYKEMHLTHGVVNETLRLGNIVQNVFRKASVDVQFKGYDIPRGWGILPVFSAIHFDEDVYDEPYRFDPWRWQNGTKTADLLQNYMPFSQGVHKCAGMELAKMEVAIFLRHLVLKYDWELVGQDHPVSFFGLSDFPKGLPIKVHIASHET